MKTNPAGGVVNAFQLAYGISDDGGAARDRLPKNPIARLVSVKTTLLSIDMGKALAEIEMARKNCAAYNEGNDAALLSS